MIRVGDTELYTSGELAHRLDVSKRTLTRWRSEGLGPPIVQLGRTYYYRVEAVEVWLKRVETGTAA